MTPLVTLVELCEPLPDDALLTALGSALEGSGLNVSPVEPDRVRRFAQQWLRTKGESLRARMRATETYRIWAATAGSEQVMEPAAAAAALVESGIPDEVAAPAAVLLQRRAAGGAEDYDVAVSCADRDAGYVGEVVGAARAEGLRVFHDREMTFEWWGKNFLAEGRRVYGRRCLFFVPFFSAAYLADTRRGDAFATALGKAIEHRPDCILPVLVGEVEVPPELLAPYIGRLRAEKHSPAEIASALHARVTEARARPTETHDFGMIVRDD